MNLESNHDMDEIIDNLYLGSFEGAQNIYKIKDLGIKKVLTVMDYNGGPNYDPKEFIHKRIDILDNCPQNILQYLGECLNFIKGEEKVLVHCMAGASRSATVVIAYLMWIKKWEYEQTFDYVKSKRPIVRPNDGFQDQLKIFEKLLIDNEYNIDKINFKDIKWDPSESLLF